MLNELALEPAPKSPVAARDPGPVDLEDEAAARARMYRLLAGVFAEEPDAAFLAALRAPEAMRALAQAGVRFDADFTQPALEALVDQLSAEYTTMFVAAGGFPPVESVRLTGRYYQGPHFAVREEYRRFGFQVRKGRHHVFDDQLGVELSFVAELLERALAVLQRNGAPEYQSIERDVKRFWALHLGRWVRGYAGLVARATEHSFYREMAKLLGAFAEDEIAGLRLRVEDVDQGREVVPKSDVQVLFNPDEPVCNACDGGGARTTR